MKQWNVQNAIIDDPSYFWLYSDKDTLIYELAKVLNTVKVCKSTELEKCGGVYDILQYKKINDGNGNTTQETWISYSPRIVLADGMFVMLQRTNSTTSCETTGWINSKDENGNFIEDPSSPTGFAGQYVRNTVCGRLAYDTNGLKPPNQIGVDVFQIPYDANGTIGTDSDSWGNINYILKFDKLINTEKYTPGKY